MIDSIMMHKAPAGNWVIIITDHTGYPRGWWDYDYKTPEQAEKALTAKVKSAMSCYPWPRS